MYSVSQNFKNYIKMPSRTLSSRLAIGSSTYTDTEIVDMSLDSNLVPGEEFTLGCTVCNKFEATIMTADNILTLNEVKPHIGLDINGTIEEVPLGIFTIDNVKVTKSNKKIVAYDNMMKFEKAYFSSLTYPATIQAIATEICKKAGVGFSSTLPNCSLGKIEGKTLREAIGIIAGICGGFARINRVGALEIVGLTATDIAITPENFFGSIEKADKNFAIKKITAIKEDNTVVTAGSGFSNEEITFSNNFITQAMLNTILTAYNNYNYRPLKFNWQGNPLIDVGDKISIVDVDGITYQIPVMRLKLVYKGGLKSEISSLAKSNGKSEYNYKGPVSKKIERLVIEQANIKELMAEKVDTVELTATNAKINTLEVNAETVNTLLAGNLSAKNMQAGFITAESGLIANAAIKDAMIDTVSVNKIIAGDISTTKFRIVSANGNMLIADNTIQIKDSSRVRVQIGKDASNDYNMYVWDSTGNLMFDATGLKSSGIKDKIIRDDMVSDTANISATKIEKESLITQINGATTLLKATKVKLDSENQTLDIAFTSLKSTVTTQGNTISSQGTSISAIQGQISSKMWQADITTAVDNIQIGGRNYFRKDTKIQSYNKVYYDLTHSECINGLYFVGGQGDTGILRLLNVITSNGYWTVSFETRGSQSCPVGFNINFCDLSSTWVSTTADNTWRKISLTANITNHSDVYNFIDFAQISWAYLFVRNLKIEKGTQATDWTPAPEDIDAQITTINTNYSSLNQTVSGISANVSSLQTTTSDLGKRMTTAETSITANTNAINLKASKTDLETTNNNLGGVTNRLSTAEGQLSVQAGQIASKVDANGVKSTIEQNPATIEVAFNKIASDKIVVSAEGLKLISNDGSYSQQKSEGFCKVRTIPGIRYIRDWCCGNNRDTLSYWDEIQVLVGSTNVARGIVPTCNFSGIGNIGVITDGAFSTCYYSLYGNGNYWVQLDLGSLRTDLTKIIVSHTVDGRIFYGTYTEVSADGIHWIPVYDSKILGGYAETSTGKAISVPELLSSRPYMYLTYLGSVSFTGTSAANFAVTITLPDEFRGKYFTVTASNAEAVCNDKYAIQQINANVSNYDYANGTFVLKGAGYQVHVDNSAVVAGIYKLTVAYTAIV